MKTRDFSRRKFIETTATGTAAVAVSASIPAFGNITPVRNETEKLAILGGTPAAPDKKWPDWPYIDEKVVEEVVKTTRSGIWCRIQSPNGTVPTFEKELAKVYGIKNTVSTGSGTQALNTVVEALELGPGDEIITSPYTDPGTIQSILVSRALPVMADLDTESFQLDPDDVERKITKNTKALMPVHMMGQPCNMERIMEIAKKHNLKVIEDSAQAHFAEYQGKRIGALINFYYKDTVFLGHTSILREYGDLHAYKILIWHTIKDAKSKGYIRLDLTGLPPNESHGQYRFKKDWNGEVVETVEYKRKVR